MKSHDLSSFITSQYDSRGPSFSLFPSQEGGWLEGGLGRVFSVTLRRAASFSL